MLLLPRRALPRRRRRLPPRRAGRRLPEGARRLPFTISFRPIDLIVREGMRV